MKCHWTDAYPNDCRAVYNKYENPSCTPTCAGEWLLSFKAEMELFQEWVWADWPPMCERASEQLLVCQNDHVGYVG